MNFITSSISLLANCTITALFVSTGVGLILLSLFGGGGGVSIGVSVVISEMGSMLDKSTNVLNVRIPIGYETNRVNVGLFLDRYRGNAGEAPQYPQNQVHSFDEMIPISPLKAKCHLVMYSKYQPKDYSPPPKPKEVVPPPPSEPNWSEIVSDAIEVLEKWKTEDDVDVVEKMLE